MPDCNNFTSPVGTYGARLCVFSLRFKISSNCLGEIRCRLAKRSLTSFKPLINRCNEEFAVVSLVIRAENIDAVKPEPYEKSNKRFLAKFSIDSLKIK